MFNLEKRDDFSWVHTTTGNIPSTARCHSPKMGLEGPSDSDPWLSDPWLDVRISRKENNIHVNLHAWMHVSWFQVNLKEVESCLKETYSSNGVIVSSCELIIFIQLIRVEKCRCTFKLKTCGLTGFCTPHWLLVLAFRLSFRNIGQLICKKREYVHKNSISEHKIKIQLQMSTSVCSQVEFTAGYLWTCFATNLQKLHEFMIVSKNLSSFKNKTWFEESFFTKNWIWIEWMDILLTWLGTTGLGKDTIFWWLRSSLRVLTDLGSNSTILKTIVLWIRNSNLPRLIFLVCCTCEIYFVNRELTQEDTCELRPTDTFVSCTCTRNLWFSKFFSSWQNLLDWEAGSSRSSAALEVWESGTLKSPASPAPAKFLWSENYKCLEQENNSVLCMINLQVAQTPDHGPATWCDFTCLQACTDPDLFNMITIC